MYLNSYRRRGGAGILLCLSCAGSALAQSPAAVPPALAPGNIIGLEYFFDADPGFGNATQVAVTPGTDITAAATVNTAGVRNGVHYFYLRARNAGGWGLTNALPFYMVQLGSLPPHTLRPVTRMEYFFDADPGFGNATPVPVTAGNDIAVPFGAATGQLAKGVHYLGIRTGDAAGWAQTNVVPLYMIQLGDVRPTAPLAPIVRAEYFIDTDPGFGNGHNIPLTAGTDITAASFAADISGLAVGVHNFFIRMQDANGAWSLSNMVKLPVVTVNVVIPPATAAASFSGLEYFFDTDPGFGNGIPLAFPATADLSSFPFTADISGLPNGKHTLYVRSKGNWSLTNAQPFQIGSTSLPVQLLQFSARREERTVALSWQTAQEHDHACFVIERSADGKDFDSIGRQLPDHGPGMRHDYRFTDAQPLGGISYYRLRMISVNGTAVYSPVVSVQRPDGGAGLFTVNNPVTTLLRVRPAEALREPLQLRITDISGRERLRLSAIGPCDWDVQSLPAGEYLLTGYANGKVQQLKLIKY